MDKHKTKNDTILTDQQKRIETLEGINAGLNHSLKKAKTRVADLQSQVVKWQRIRTPTHGDCCTCQACGLGYDSCRCDLDDLADDNERLKDMIREKDDIITDLRTEIERT